jgi:putative MATE family efflux protein
VFRGLADTTTPLLATLGSNALNVLLVPLMLHGLHLGVGGVAAATVLAQLVPCALLMRRLAERCGLSLGGGAIDARLFAPTAWLVLRTAAIAGTYAAATSLATRAGADAAAAHAICFQIMMSAALLSDSLAVAAQTLTARALAGGDAARAARVIGTTVRMALLLGLAVAAALAAGGGALPRLFTSAPGVLAAAALVMPAVVATQPLNSLAFVLDGALFGAGGFRFASVAMAAAAAPAVALMALGAGAAAGAGAAPADAALMAVWAGLTLLMAIRAGAIALPLHLRGGAFRALRG